jgi:hypothetical protein
MKRYHQYPVQQRIAVLGTIGFCLWSFYLWTFSPHATAQRVERQQQSIEAQVNGLNAIFIQLAGQCFQFAADRDSLLTAVNWRFVRLWQTLDEQLNPPYENTPTALFLSDTETLDFDLDGN